MGFQTSVNQYQALGIPGEFADDSPSRVTPYACLANSTAQPTVGYVFTQGTADNEAKVGGTGAYLGVLIEPKQYANYNGDLSATLAVKPGTIGEICSMGHIFVKSATAFAPGYVAAYANSTGAISAYASASSIPEGSTQIPAKFIKVSGAANAVGILELGAFVVPTENADLSNYLTTAAAEETYQPKLTAGDFVDITDNTITTTYSAGTGIAISADGEISASGQE